MSLTAILKIGASVFSGFYFHGCLYMTLIEHPSRSGLPIEAYVQHWRRSCNLARMFILPCELLTLVLTVILCFIDEAEVGNLWIICPACTLATLSWTIIMILPELKLTTMDDVHVKKDHGWIRTAVDLIMKRHLVRIALTAVVHLTTLKLSCSG